MPQQGLPPPQEGDLGICRVTGAETYGTDFPAWVAKRDKFNDYAILLPGTILSYEALLTFDEQSTLLAQKTGRDKPQRFRTYCHIVTEAGEWHACTKADKQLMLNLITTQNPVVVCLTDTGQKHLLCKAKRGFWQLDDSFIVPDVALLTQLHTDMMHLLSLGFSQTEVKSGNYNSGRIIAVGIKTWQEAENKIKHYRNMPIFDLAAWLMYAIK